MTRLGFRSLGARLSFWIALPGTLVFISVIGANYYLSRNLLQSYIGELARATAASTAYKLETVFNSVAENANALASVVATVPMDASQLEASIRAMLRNDAQIFGMTVALEPHLLKADIGLFSPYYYRKDGSFAYADLASADYDYQKWDWYTRPKAADRALWSEPYLDTGGGGVLMTTYSTPIRAGSEKRFAGVATADIALDWLQDVVKAIHIGDNGYGFIASHNQLVVAHPNPKYNLVPLTALLGKQIDPANREKDPAGEVGETTRYFYSPCRRQPGMCWTAVEALGATGWEVFIVAPERELLADLNAHTTQIALIAASGFVLLPVFVVLITRRQIKPLGLLAKATHDIGGGNLDAVLPSAIRDDEIGALTTDFINMRDSLKNYLMELRETTAKQQKLESELQIAREIQMSMLIGAGHVDVLDDGCQLFALLRPASSVGGDLYHFQRHGDVLHFIIGDVSDKGVPAALFMAKAITLYTEALGDGASPASVLFRMNQALYQNNDSCMFVTALCGCLHTRNGELVMANAGHMHPLLKTSHKTVELAVSGGTALGLTDAPGYRDVSLRLSEDSLLLMYTDGITEAFNGSCAQYSEQRLAALVGASETMQPCRLAGTVVGDLDSFRAGADQSDDITLLLIGYGQR